MASVEAYVCIIHQSYPLSVHTVAPNAKCTTLHIVDATGWQLAVGGGRFPQIGCSEFSTFHWNSSDDCISDYLGMQLDLL
jgi:hypothetical protein